MRHPEDDTVTTSGPHADEGTIHAWLDGALSPTEAAALERHVAACAACAAAVAEARGLVAASTRILGALDAVPGGVLPAAATSVAAPRPDVRPIGTAGAAGAAGAGGANRRAPRAWRRWPGRAAAAVLLAAVGTWAVVDRRGTDGAGGRTSDLALERPAPAAALEAAPARGADDAVAAGASMQAAVGFASKDEPRAATLSPAKPAMETDAVAAIRSPERRGSSAPDAPALRAAPTAPAPTVVAPMSPPAADGNRFVAGGAVRAGVAPTAGARRSAPVPAPDPVPPPAPAPAPAPPPPPPPSAVASLDASIGTTAGRVEGCYRADAAPEAREAPEALRRALASPIHLTAEEAGGDWRWVRADARPGAGATVARWRAADDGAITIEWPAPDGVRLRLRVEPTDAGRLVGEARVGSGGGVPVTLRSTACAGG